MPVRSKLPSIIHSASTVTPAVFSAHTYYEVYAGTGGGSALINGSTIQLPAGSDISMVIRTFDVSSVTGNLFLLGDKRDVSYGSNIIGGSFTS